MGKVYDTFITKDFEELKEDEEITGVLRDLSPGKTKYKGIYAKFRISKDPAKYPNTLWVRLGRGQLVDKPCSVMILEEVKPF
ncbi:MAG: phenylphosphate carboxylase subunit gamma [Desulfobacterota bacterium]|nr:phenylphosphate carboxylase subunit gamma [Thermodesulfobacteriota bacterium]MDW8001870.1 phenylphosphate carboxylase subunit gamma [Deltaproteobacteria bacterium]